MKKTNIIKMFFILLVVGTCITCNAAEKKKKTKPNILFILIDDLGKEWVSGYGANDVKTPTVDKMIASGMCFNNTYSMPQCTPTRITLLTGQYPWRHGWVNHYDVPRWGHGARFDPDLNPSFAKMLKDGGYVTCAAGKWQINDFRLEPEAMQKAGFDEYCMWTGGEGGNIGASQERYWNPYIHTKKGSKTYEGQFGEDIFSDFIIDFMKKNKEKPMMIYYPMCLTHGPLTTTPLEPDAPRAQQHKAMVRYTDFILEKLLNALDELNLRKNTIVFWATDNGTSGNIMGHLNGYRVWGGKTLLSENGVNAPFVVNAPGIVPKGVVNDALVDFTDLLPTFCDLGGITPNKNFTYDGKSFAPEILGKKNKSPREWIMALGSNPAQIKNGRVHNAFKFRDRVIRDKQYKAYIDTLNQIVEIIDLKNDFYEEHNLIRSDSPEVKFALSKFQKVLNDLPKEDAQPKYTKLNNSIYDIDEEELLKSSNKGKLKANKSPHPDKRNKKKKNH